MSATRPIATTDVGAAPARSVAGVGDALLDVEAAWVPGACRHCGLPTASADDAFCCIGCETVYHALRTAGFDGDYYRLRDVARKRPPTAADTRIDPLLEREVDSDWFLQEHARPEADGCYATTLNLDGVHCAACLWLIERLPDQVEGVQSARLDLARARLTLTWNPSTLPLSHVVRWLARFGYRAHPAGSTSAGQQAGSERQLLIRLGVAWALAGNVMLIAFAMYSGLEAAGGGLAGAARWLSLALAVPAVAYAGFPFLSRAAASVRLAVRARSLRPLHMDVPIALGILVGFTHSAWATVTGLQSVWFDSITVLIAALLTARWLQERSRRLAGDAADRLLALVPSMARRIAANGAVEIVRTEALAAGDVVEVPAEEVVPIDGEVVSGTTSINNAVLTGESEPVPVGPGSPVHAGAMNLSSVIRLRTLASGEETRVGRLLAWMRQPDAAKARVVLLADRIGGYFVASVVVLAAATALIWLRIEPASVPLHVTALLVITCPCALGMATPLAMTVAAGRAARAGVYVKHESALQALTEVDAFVLDKTGTLTEGRPALVERFGDEKAIALASALEAHSNHLLARALLTAVRPSSDGATDVVLETGSGVRGTIGCRDVRVGRPAWILAACTTVPEGLRERIETCAGRGLTPVAVAVDGQLRAVLAFGDRIRASAEAFVAGLHARGQFVYLLSGDRIEVARDVASQLGIAAENVVADASPEQKHAYVQELQRAGKRVAMMGDGVNDAAALRAADVGIAVGGGAAASYAAADVFLVQEGLEPVSALISGADVAMQTVRRNLGFSLLYNVAGAAAAMAGVVTPLLAAVAMPVSSLTVVGLSILQRSFVRQRG